MVLLNGLPFGLQFGNLNRFARSRAQCFVQNVVEIPSVARCQPFAVLLGEMVAAAFCGNPQFLIGRVAVDDDLRAVRRLRWSGRFPANWQSKSRAVFVDLVFDVFEQFFAHADEFAFGHHGFLCVFCLRYRILPHSRL